MKQRKIMFVTGSRGEYGYIRPILRKIKQDPFFSYRIVATNMHLVATFGHTINEFYDDDFTVHYKPEMTLASFKPGSMMKSLCIFGLSMTDILEHDTPDIILLAGDRGEQLMAAMAGAHFNIPVAHIQAGEISGNIDGVMRHAIARYAHIHFAANDDSAKRLLESGEQAFRVHNVGAPQLDEFIDSTTRKETGIHAKFNLNQDEPIILVMQHSVTEEVHLAKKQMDATLAAIAELKYQTIVIYPNCDAGSSDIQKSINDWQRPFISVYRNLPRNQFISLMKIASIMVGNSSAGILETPTFRLPTVNIGRRQLGRVQGKNVINCDHQTSAILESIKKALSPEFKASLRNLKNPYGDGKSSERILNVLKNVQINEQLLFKELTI